MSDEPLRSQQAELLAAEVGEHDRAARWIGAENSGQLHHSGGARRVIVGAVADRVLRFRVLSVSARAPEVIEVRANHDVLVSKNGISSTEKRDHVLAVPRLRTAHVRFFCRERIEWLEVSGRQAGEPK